jgi:hypothetical protein
VIILRHGALPLALNHAMWEKYKIGETFKVNDPETKAPAKKNPYFQPKPGILNNDDIASTGFSREASSSVPAPSPCGNRPDAFQAMRASRPKKLLRNSWPTSSRALPSSHQAYGARTAPRRRAARTAQAADLGKASGGEPPPLRHRQYLLNDPSFRPSYPRPHCGKKTCTQSQTTECPGCGIEWFPRSG